jgi:hypothetical protein
MSDPKGKPFAEHPFGMEIYSRDQRESFILHAANLSQEVLKSYRYFVDAQTAFALLVCKEVTGERAPTTHTDVVQNLNMSKTCLVHTSGPFAYLDTIVVELHTIDLYAKNIDLHALGNALVAQEAVKDIAWYLLKEYISAAHFKEVYDIIKKHITEVEEHTQKLIATLQLGTGAAREGIAAQRLMKSRPVNVAVDFGILRSSWNTLLDMMFIAEICGTECWYNLKNYRPVILAAS